MIARCTSEKATHFKLYGGRGIIVCKRWLLFSNFLKDMGNRPKGTRLVRLNTSGNYVRRNCAWLTLAEYARRRRASSHLLRFRGKKRSLTQLAKEMGISHPCVVRRLQRGWRVKDALTRPSPVAVHSAKRTACPKGHPYDAENTRIKRLKDGTTERVCRTCSREQKRRDRRKKA